MLDTYQEKYQDGIIELWNSSATRIGYKELTGASFAERFTGNPYFNPKQTFILQEDGKVTGFACGCVGDDLPFGKTSGYLACVILDERFENSNNYRRLIESVEDTFKAAGKTQSEVLFFCPILLPWYIEGTDHHEHNNAPGVFKGSRLYHELLENGYIERATEKAMYLKLENFDIPEKINKKEKNAELEGYEITIYDKERHYGAEEMLMKLNNPLWLKEISLCMNNGIPVLVAADKGRIVGFAGPMICQSSGRGYFAGIGVVKEHEGHGLGTVLFYKLCREERKVGAQYMSLFTGADNPAGKIYEKAGFVTVQEFAVMRKML